jgi:hypothetical protein
VRPIHLKDEVALKVRILKQNRVALLLQNPSNPGRPCSISLVEANVEVALLHVGAVACAFTDLRLHIPGRPVLPALLVAFASARLPRSDPSLPAHPALPACARRPAALWTWVAS